MKTRFFLVKPQEVQQESLYCQPKQGTTKGEIPQTYHTFALFQGNPSCPPKATPPSNKGLIRPY